MSIGNPPTGDSTPTDERPSIGRALSKARLDAGLTIDQVSSRTRVRAPIIHAIEQDDFSRCGGDFYARGHIRQLAKTVGLDPEALVAQYDAQHGALLPVPAGQLFDAERIRPERRRPNWTAAMVAAIAVVIAFVAFNMVSGGSEGSGDSVAGKPSSATPSASPSKTTKPSATPTTPGPSDSAIAGAPADKVTVKLTATGGKSWILATDGNGRTLFQSVLNQGQSKTFVDDDEIRLVVGNAGAVKLFVNGKDLGPAGRTGAVAHLNYTPGDPEAG